MHRGKCPKCGSSVAAVNVDNVNIIGAGGSCGGIAYLCQHCDTVLGFSMYQLSLNDDVVKKLLKALHDADPESINNSDSDNGFELAD
jgi:hypothetical protein